jgi:hypothetical protein
VKIVVSFLIMKIIILGKCFICTYIKIYWETWCCYLNIKSWNTLLYWALKFPSENFTKHKILIKMNWIVQLLFKLQRFSTKYNSSFSPNKSKNNFAIFSISIQIHFPQKPKWIFINFLWLIKKQEEEKKLIKFCGYKIYLIVFMQLWKWE